MNEPQENESSENIGHLMRPIWELELVISGAVIVGLFQIPQVVTGLFESAQLHLSDDAFWLPYFIYFISMMALVGLISIFGIHFIVRSLWVAVLGLNRAYPGGVDWEKIDLGPLQKAFYRKRIINLKDLEPKIDRLASSLFAGLFVVLIYALMIGLVFAITYGFAGIVGLILPEVSETKLFMMLALVGIALPLAIAGIFLQLVDARLGKDETFESRHPRLVAITRRLLKVIYIVSMVPLYGPVVLTLRSRISNTRFIVISNLLSLFFVVLVAAVMFISMGLFRNDSYIYFPDRPAVAGYDPDHYATTRNSENSPRIPWIQSDLIERPMVRLFLPFRARSGNELLAEVCPELEPFHDDGLRMAARRKADPEPTDQVIIARDCLFRLFEIKLNDKALSGIEGLFSSDPDNEVKGLLVPIVGDPLLIGRNHLQINVKSRLESYVGDGSRTVIYHIPFWYYPESG